MWLLKEITKADEPVEKADPAEISDAPAPVEPDGWSIGHLANHGVLLACDGFQLKLDAKQLDKFFDIAESGDIGEIRDQSGKIVGVEPTADSIILTRVGDPVYPSGVVLDLGTLKDLGIEQDEQERQDAEDGEDDNDPAQDAPDDPADDTIDNKVEEGVHVAYKRSGKKIVKGFRVTSGYRKGRVVTNLKTAYKPKPPAATRMKLSRAAKRHKVVRVLKSKRTRRMSISKRLKRMNQGR